MEDTDIDRAVNVLILNKTVCLSKLLLFVAASVMSEQFLYLQASSFIEESVEGDRL